MVQDANARVNALVHNAQDVSQRTGMPYDQAQHDVAVIAERFDTLGMVQYGVTIASLSVEPVGATAHVVAVGKPIPS